MPLAESVQTAAPIALTTTTTTSEAYPAKGTEELAAKDVTTEIKSEIIPPEPAAAATTPASAATSVAASRRTIPDSQNTMQKVYIYFISHNLT